MGLFSIEHSQTAYRIDFAAYATAVVVLAVVLVARAPASQGPALLGGAAAGLIGWTALEYGLHRFVLHALPPFAGWHVEHHRRPTALICLPTWLSGALIGGLVFLPAWLASGLWPALALTLGVLTGYLGYTVTHHAIHHWRTDSGWLRRRKRWHARHHRQGATPDCFGVTTALWDRVCGSGHRATPLTRGSPPHRRSSAGRR
jgi:sterol desaturase/sphingolipid hydroxylase (fatty acid hydroxylase superfamily)